MISLNRKALIIIAVLAISGIAGFYIYERSTEKIILRVSTTTSLYATGLLDALADAFKAKTGNIVVQFIPVGSGAALELAKHGDVDMVFVHAPNLEVQYIVDGVLTNGTIIAYNYFVIVGPKEDPANINGTSPIEAMKKIYFAGENGTTEFISRGDNSGTHVRELILWNLAGLNASGKSWYIETGTGMSNTLLIANEYGAYTLSDIGTYLKLKKEGRLPNLEALVTDGDILINVYSAYLVNSTMYPSVKVDLAMEFINFVRSDEGQDIIANFGVSEFGTPLFYPAKGKEDELKEDWNWLSNMTLSQVF